MLHCSFDPNKFFVPKNNLWKTSPPLFSGLWNLVFLFSNLSLVFLMPFAYFFTESEGFAGSKKVQVLHITQLENSIHLDLLIREYLFCVGGDGTSV